MMSASDSANNHKLGSVPSSSTNESSSNSSNRCIRNNSYLNANPTLNLLKEQQEAHNQVQASMLNGLMANGPDLRPSSSSSNSSGSSGVSKQQLQQQQPRRSKGAHNGHVQLEIINEKNHTVANGEPADYASYEITV